MEQAVRMTASAGQTIIESGVLGSLVILQFALLALMVWQFIRTINRNTAAISKFTDMLERLPCLDRDGSTECEHMKGKGK